MDTIEFFREALKDHEVKDIVFLSVKHKKKLEKLLREHPEQFYLSEWEYQLWGIEFRYHIHDEIKGRELKRLYDIGERAGNPSLFGIYSRMDLEEKLNGYTSKVSQDTLEIHY